MGPLNITFTDEDKRKGFELLAPELLCNFYPLSVRYEINSSPSLAF